MDHEDRRTIGNIFRDMAPAHYLTGTRVCFHQFTLRQIQTRRFKY